MFPFQINNYNKSSSPGVTSVFQGSNKFTDQQQDQGFQQKQPLVLQIVTSILGLHAPSIQLPIKRKAIFRNPLCIYTTGNLFTYSQSIDQIPKQISQLNIQIDKTNQDMKKITDITCIGDPTAKISEFTINKKMVCIYNRHNQNLINKNDMTIFIKNIKMAVQNDMLRTFDKLHQQNNTIFLGQYKPSINSKVRLEFNSNFEGSNLHSVFWQNNTNNYYLFIQNDINTHGYNQWFSFCARAISYSNQQQVHQQIQMKQKMNKTHNNLKRTMNLNQNYMKNNENIQIQAQNKYTAKLIIVNISKDIKYKNSMKILTYKNNKWSYNTPFIYYKNKYQRYNYTNYSTIQFQYNFQINQIKRKQIKQIKQNKQNNNYIYFYLTYPYTYTKLIKFLKQIKINQFKKWKIDLESIGKSQGNNQIYMISFINKQNKLDKNKNQVENSELQQIRKSKKIIKYDKKCVIILARQHPGQTVSSFICQYLIKQILNSTISSQKQPFDWFIIPMANPDGVIHGNTRTNLKGYDINRCWIKNLVFYCSQVEVINKAIQQIKQKYNISYVIDLHGHSKDFGAFAYFSQDNDISKIINLLISQKCKFFNYYKSKYGIDYKKRPTFRGQMYYRNQIKNAITIQVSLFGYKQLNQQHSSNQIKPFCQQHFKQLANAIYHTLVQYQQIKQQSQMLQSQNISVKDAMKKIGELQKSRPKIYQNQEGSSTDSDSDPQDEYLQRIQRISVGIDIPEEKIQQFNQNINLKHQNESSKLRYGDKSDQKIQQKQQIRTALLQKYKTFHKKNKQKNIKRKPIYTNSNVEITNFHKMQQLQKSLKKFSYDQSNQLLSQKTIIQIQQTKNRRTNLSASQRKINGLQMRSKQSLIYPTASNIKIDLIKAAQQQQLNALYYSTRLWNAKQKTIADYIRKTKKQKTKSIIIQPYSDTPKKQRLRKTQYSQQKRKQSHKQLIKLKQFLLTKSKIKVTNLPKQQMNITKLSIVSKRLKTG